MFMDFRRAVDSLKWEFMLFTLKHFSFDDSFVNWAKTMYTDIQTCIINNVWVSEMFKNTIPDDPSKVSLVGPSVCAIS